MTIVEQGVYFILGKKHPALLCYYDFSTGRTDTITQVSGYVGYHLAVSRDGKSFLYDRSERFESDLIMVEDFH